MVYTGIMYNTLKSSVLTHCIRYENGGGGMLPLYPIREPPWELVFDFSNTMDDVIYLYPEV